MAYRNAPIREAVFNIRVEGLSVHDATELSSIREHVHTEFPIEKVKHDFTTDLPFSSGEEFGTTTSTAVSGYYYQKEDSSSMLQVANDGFTLNVLKPYLDWETHFGTFLKFWDIYNSKFLPKKLTQLSISFINKIEIPLPATELQDYILNLPTISHYLPQTFSSFFLQTEVPTKDKLRNVLLTETLESQQDTFLPFILGIEVFQTEGIENSSKNISSNFAAMRIIKNEIFESCISDKTRNLFN